MDNRVLLYNLPNAAVTLDQLDILDIGSFVEYLGTGWIADYLNNDNSINNEVFEQETEDDFIISGNNVYYFSAQTPIPDLSSQYSLFEALINARLNTTNHLFEYNCKTYFDLSRQEFNDLGETEKTEILQLLNATIQPQNLTIQPTAELLSEALINENISIDSEFFNEISDDMLKAENGIEDIEVIIQDREHNFIPDYEIIIDKTFSLMALEEEEIYPPETAIFNDNEDIDEVIDIPQDAIISMEDPFEDGIVTNDTFTSDNLSQDFNIDIYLDNENKEDDIFNEDEDLEI